MVRSMQTVECTNCGITFSKLTKEIKQKKTHYHFCSKKCYFDFRRENPNQIKLLSGLKKRSQCSRCEKKFSPTSNSQKYCVDCIEKAGTEKRKRYKQKKRAAKITNNKNKSSYGRNKTILLNYQWGAIVYGHKNYMVVKKLRDDGSRDIWDVVKDSVKRGRVTYFSNLDSALNNLFEHRLLDYVNNKRSYGANVYALKNAIIDVKKELLEVFYQQCPNVSGSLRQTDSETENRSG